MVICWQTYQTVNCKNQFASYIDRCVLLSTTDFKWYYNDMKYLVIMLYIDTKRNTTLIIIFFIALDVYFEFEYQGHIHSKCRNYVAKNR